MEVIMNACAVCVPVSVCQLEQLKKRIQQSMKTLPKLKPYTWKSVLGCAVIGPDMLWYRGEVLEVLGEHVKVKKTHILPCNFNKPFQIDSTTSNGY